DGKTRTYPTSTRIAPRDPVLLDTPFVIQPVLLRSVFSCGDKNLYFTQEGVHSYRFAIRTHQDSLVPHDAAKFGWEHNTPLIVKRSRAHDGTLPDTHSFIKVSADNVLVTIVKKAEDGKGIIVRCYETDGVDTDVSIQCPATVRRATATSIIEEDLSPIPVGKEGAVRLHVGKYAIETLRLEF
ncbi:MAG: glycosyl hydrolase-related protein, partial [Pirellulales bacterium]